MESTPTPRQAVPPNETKQERIRRVAREWYWRNRERIREKKHAQCGEYRRRLRAGRPPKTEKTMFFNTETGEITNSTEKYPEPPPRRHKPEKKSKKEEAKNIPTTEIVSGKFLVEFT